MLPAQARHWLSYNTRHACIQPFINCTLRVYCSASMGSHTTAKPELTLVSASPSATQLLAHYFASSLRQGDTYLLYGDVGSGKSYFSRSFIRAALKDEDLPVPSPTFLLQNIYDPPLGVPIHHFDLYRLTDVKDLQRLDLPASFSGAVSLLEWPGILGSLTPASHLELRISILPPSEQAALARNHAPGGRDSVWEVDDLDWDSDDGSGDARWRRIELTPHGAEWQQRLKTLVPFIEEAGAEFGCWKLT